MVSFDVKLQRLVIILLEQHCQNIYIAFSMLHYWILFSDNSYVYVCDIIVKLQP